jgi:DNA polymerase III alpha subunit (gram-positive type)
VLNEIGALLANGGYTLKSVIECNDEIFVFLLNESELSKTTTNTTIEEHTSE